MKKQHEHLDGTKRNDVDIVYCPYIPMQTVDKENIAKVEKILKESAKHECNTKYGLTSKTDYASRYAIEVLESTNAKNNKIDEHLESTSKVSISSDYVVLNFDQYKELGRQRIDESKDIEWQCPTCKHRVKNLQRERTKDGSPCWGCHKFCDTLDASYFHGKACKLYEEGHSGWVWW